MKYDKESSTLSITSRELVFCAMHRRASVSERAGVIGVNDMMRSSFVGHPSPLALSLPLARPLPLPNGSDISVTVTGDADDIHDSTLTVIRRVSGSTTRLLPDDVRAARGEAFCLAYLALGCGAISSDSVCLNIIYVGDGTGDFREEREVVEAEAIARFFEKLLTASYALGKLEAERIGCRLPTLEALKFPFPDAHSSQVEFMEYAERTLSEGGNLFVCAPTGTGKTMAALFPAVRALGRGEIDKIFYLTARGTGAYPAIDATRTIVRAGGKLRAVVISAKEKLCTRGRDCGYGRSRCPCLIDSGERMAAAIEELLSSGRSPVTSEELICAARAHRVCPYELSLDYSMICDLIICDFNYLFDLRVYLRRYFDEGGNYCFLIDEAHDLLPRAREMYSDTLQASLFSSAASLLDEVSFTSYGDEMRECMSKFRASLLNILSDSDMSEDSDGVRRRFAHSGECADSAIAAVTEAQAILERALSAKGKATAANTTGDGARDTADIIHELREKHYRFCHTLTIASLYDRRYETFVTEEGDEVAMRMFCIDPSRILKKRLARGKCSIFFSATLSPVDYYRATLGGGEGEILSLSSPFDKSNLCIAALDKIPVRYSMREESLSEVARAIEATVRAKAGNYMVFCPSFAYMEKLNTVFCAIAPDIPVIAQKRYMNADARARFLDSFTSGNGKSLCAFCVLGGIYSEGIDLVGDRLIGAVIIGVGMPQISIEREAIAAYYDRISDCGREYAYTYPGMNRVMQAAGRVIRSESDRGVLVLIDERFADEEYRRIVPESWHSLKYASTNSALARLLARFWNTEK